MSRSESCELPQYRSRECETAARDVRRIITTNPGATSQDGMVQETFFKTLTFNILMDVRASLLQITDNGVAVG